MSNWMASGVDEVDEKAQVQIKEYDEEAQAKKDALVRVKEAQTSALSTSRARAAASGAAGGTLADYFTSIEKGFERENQWLSRSNVRSSVAGAHADYYDSAAKQQGFGFLATENKDWWA